MGFSIINQPFWIAPFEETPIWPILWWPWPSTMVMKIFRSAWGGFSCCGLAWEEATRRTAGEQLQRRHGATRDRSYIGLRNGVVRSWDLASQAQNRSSCEHHGFHRQIMKFMDSRDQNLEIILETWNAIMKPYVSIIFKAWRQKANITPNIQ